MAGKLEKEIGNRKFSGLEENGSLWVIHTFGVVTGLKVVGPGRSVVRGGMGGKVNGGFGGGYEYPSVVLGLCVVTFGVITLGVVTDENIVVLGGTITFGVVMKGLGVVTTLGGGVGSSKGITGGS